MTISTTTLTDAQRDKVLAISESHFSDGKAQLIKPSKLSRTISAFANADGGELYIGLREVKENSSWAWEGFVNEEAANGHIQAFEALFPVGERYKATFFQHPDEQGLVLHVYVPKSKGVIRTTDKKVFVRKGAQSLPFDTPDKMKRLELNKGISSFESETVSIAANRITNSGPIIEFLLDVIPTAEPGPWLRMQELLQDGKPTVAGVLLFADLPQAILPKRCGVKVYRYNTDAEPTRDALETTPSTLEGHIYQVIYDAVAETQRQLQGAQVLGPEGLQDVEYPPETLHEVITNAVLHRDYSIADDVHVRIFDNRVEVESPGLLPAHVTTKNILDERFARNGQVVRLVNKFPNPPNQDVGEGLRTAFDRMKELRLKEPIIRQTEHSVVVEIRHERMAKPEQLIMEYLSKNRQVTNAIARKLCAISSENKVKEAFYRLRDRGLIERVPGLRGNKAAWQKLVPESDSSTSSP